MVCTKSTEKQALAQNLVFFKGIQTHSKSYQPPPGQKLILRQVTVLPQRKEENSTCIFTEYTTSRCTIPATLPWLHRCPRPANLLQQDSKYLHSFLPGVMVSAQRKSASHAAHRQDVPLVLNYREACFAMTTVAHQLFPIFQRKESYTSCIILLTGRTAQFLDWNPSSFLLFPFPQQFLPLPYSTQEKGILEIVLT